MRRYSLSAAMLLAMIAGPLSGCAHTGSGGFATTRAQKMEGQFDLARLAESENQLDRSREMYQAILKKDPSNATVHHRLGIVSARQGRFAEAKKYFDEAHALTPGNPEILNDLGYACYLNGDYKEAEAALQEALKVNSEDRRATNNLALVMGSQGRLEESYALFRRVNKEAEAHSNVAYLYAQQGEGKKALEHYSRALSLNPEMKNAGNAMVEIARLKQKMESDRELEKTQLAGATIQPTPAVQQVVAAKPAIPQLQSVIDGGQAAARQPVDAPQVASTVAQQTQEQIAANAFEFEDQQAPAATATPVITPSITARTAAPTAIAEAATAQQQPTAIIEEEIQQEETATIVEVETPKQETAAIAEAPVAKPATTIDYAALCPQAAGEVAELVGSMNSQDVVQIKAALHKLGELSGAAAAAAPAVESALTHADPYVRVHSALALWRIQQNTQKSIPAFVEGLQSSDAGVRSFAATALAMGPQDNTLVAPLTAALTDSNAYVRLHAAETLYQYPDQQAAASQVLLSHLNDKEANVRWLATFILGELLPKSEVAVQALTQALQDQDNRIRAGAAFALGGLGQEAAPALPELKKLTSDQQPEVRKAAEEAVRDIEHSAVQASAER